MSEPRVVPTAWIQRVALVVLLTLPLIFLYVVDAAWDRATRALREENARSRREITHIQEQALRYANQARQYEEESRDAERRFTRCLSDLIVAERVPEEARSAR
jgi:hypothetical protein